MSTKATFCPHCGDDVPEANETFCGKCGANLAALGFDTKCPSCGDPQRAPMPFIKVSGEVSGPSEALAFSGVNSRIFAPKSSSTC